MADDKLGLVADDLAACPIGIENGVANALRGRAIGVEASIADVL